MRSVSGYSSTVRVSDRTQQGTVQQKTSQAPCYWTSTSLHPRSNIQLTLTCFSMKKSPFNTKIPAQHVILNCHCPVYVCSSFSNIQTAFCSKQLTVYYKTIREWGWWLWKCSLCNDSLLHPRCCRSSPIHYFVRRACHPKRGPIVADCSYGALASRVELRY